VQPFHFDTFGPHHLAYLAGTVGVWVAVIAWGRRLEAAGRRRFAIGLVGVTLGQEITWDSVAMIAGVWKASEYLPLHLCSLALFAGAWALVSRRQLVFEVAYFWATVASSQALLTPDPSRWALGEWDALWNFLSHGVIILNVIWLVFIEGMRPRRGAWLRVLGLTNVAAAGVGLVDWATGFNYFYLRHKPGGDSPFLLGDWPYYIGVLEVIAVGFFFLAQQAIRLVGRPYLPAEGSPDPAPEGSSG
jgi:hypothetical integral membrane protein (TIGR02206 family)